MLNKILSSESVDDCSVDDCSVGDCSVDDCSVDDFRTQNSELRILFNITMKIYKYSQQ